MKLNQFRIAIILLSVIAFNLISIVSLAQDSLNIEKMKGYLYFQPNFGASQYFGDLNKNDYLNKNPQFAFGAVLGYQLCPLFGFRGQFLKADLYSVRSDQNKAFYSELWDAALHLTINVNEIFAKYNEVRTLNFYIFSGAGIASYKSTLENIKPREVVYQQTENQDEIFIPVGGGASFRISPNIAINLEYGDHITFRSDGLDFTDGGKKNDHYSYASAGIQIKYDGKDTDHDGIKDKNDACPDIPGKAELAGCPDRDNDGITDKDDDCPGNAGLIIFNGCPDTDNDGIPDKEDACPGLAGKPELNGCPDRDGDGVADKDDKCPDVPGKIELHGCLDRDGDGVIDSDDACPDKKGIASLAGCPDRDGDGIPDKDDLCPEIAGKILLKGCPDNDGDGVADKDDKCPDIAGKIEYNGCPDRDGDGIIDLADLCPDIKGLVKFAGCPDTDGDGIPDYKDKCPDVAGIESNKGCPVVIKHSTINKIIYFDQHESAVSNLNMVELNEIAAYIKSHQGLSITVKGNSDDNGSEQYNVQLSMVRMDNVINYLVNRGISASIFKKYFYGYSKPATTNKSDAGRSLNRRVEIQITQ